MLSAFYCCFFSYFLKIDVLLWLLLGWGGLWWAKVGGGCGCGRMQKGQSANMVTQKARVDPNPCWITILIGLDADAETQHTWNSRLLLGLLWRIRNLFFCDLYDFLDLEFPDFWSCGHFILFSGGGAIFPLMINYHSGSGKQVDYTFNISWPGKFYPCCWQQDEFVVIPNKNIMHSWFSFILFSRSRTNSGSSAAASGDEKKNGDVDDKDGAALDGDGHKKTKNGDEHNGAAANAKNVRLFQCREGESKRSTCIVKFLGKWKYG